MSMLHSPAGGLISRSVFRIILMEDLSVLEDIGGLCFLGPVSPIKARNKVLIQLVLQRIRTSRGEGTIGRSCIGPRQKPELGMIA